MPGATRLPKAHGRRALGATLLVLATMSRGARAEESARPRQPSAPLPETRVLVVGAPEAEGAGVDRDQVPSNVRHLDDEEIRSSRALGLGAVLDAKVGGIVVTDAQSSPLEPDVSLRGFTASPLLGAPQGLAVYQGGVRVNEPFGDTVQWDVVPEFAVAELSVIPGASPVYGRNALGGAIVLRMKDGFGFQGIHAAAEGGSFGRLRGLLESGGHRGAWGVYGASEVAAEHGFRDHSEWSARRLYASVRHRGDASDIGVSLTAAHNELRGNGPAPLDLLRERRASVFTYPDITKNRMLLVAADSDTQVSRSVSVQTTLYLRRSLRATLNADDASFVPCISESRALCDEAGEPLVGEAGGAVPASSGGAGAINTTRTVSTSLGASAQAVLSAPILGRANHLALGGAVDGAPVSFARHTEVGSLTADRGVAGSGARIGGDEGHTELTTRQVALGLYATDTLSLTERLAATASFRVDSVSLSLADQLGSALDGVHRFTRLNPGAGVTYRVSRRVTAYASYGESSRVPTAAELSCADPTAPCRIPNAFLSDPGLRQVVSRAVEVGARGSAKIARRARVQWAAAAFASQNEDDILFVAGSHVGTGFFRNAGRTRRLGAEASIVARFGRFRALAQYQLLRATFESPLVLPSPSHPEGDPGADGMRVIHVAPGDTIPSMPLHSAKIGASAEPIDGWTLGLSAAMRSSIYYRGDEANLLDPLPGYVVLDADTSYRIASWLSVFARARNLLDTAYDTFGVLGNATRVLPLARDPRFASPGAPFGIWAGLDATWR